ncbi:MAG: peptide deformylase [Verrucomicrobia bacterium]|nr:MAG: peptide deformylase [Verrucomicrobiota bacterium]
MKLPILKYGDARLRAKGKRIEQIDETIRELASDMLETMRAANGVGLAAQQVGEALQLTVIDVSQTAERPSTMALNGKEVIPNEHMPLVLLNLEIEIGPEKEIAPEGCLSFPEISGDIERSVWTRVRGQTLSGDLIEVEATGLLARALQHEVDHLNGILFIDRMSSVAKAALGSRLKRLRKETTVASRAKSYSAL